MREWIIGAKNEYNRIYWLMNRETNWQTESFKPLIVFETLYTSLYCYNLQLLKEIHIIDELFIKVSLWFCYLMLIPFLGKNKNVAVTTLWVTGFFSHRSRL